MAQLSVISSIISTASLAAFVQEKYSLNANTQCKILKTGVNHTYLIDNGDNKYVFRIYSLNWRTKTEIEEELKLLTLLQSSNINISYPIKDNRDNYIQEITAPEGERFGVLFSFAEGDKLLNFSADLHFTIGHTMASMHAVTNGLNLQRVTYTPDVLLLDPVEQIKHFLPAHTDEMQWILSTQKYLMAQLANVNHAQLRKGAVHCDIWFDNLNITKGGDVTLFDFDFCGNAWLCLDIAYYVLQLYSTEKVEAERTEKLNKFLEGYESVTPISAEEKRLLPMLGVAMYFFYLGVQCQRFDNWSNVFLNETHLKRFINLLVKKYFDENVVTPPNVNQLWKTQ